MATLSGSIHVEWRTCGRANCRCARGHRHGPYYVRRWRESDRQRKAYIRADTLPSVVLAIEASHASSVTRSMIEQVRAQTHRVGDQNGGDD
jgi:hypothetical protein